MNTENGGKALCDRMDRLAAEIEGMKLKADDLKEIPEEEKSEE